MRGSSRPLDWRRRRWTSPPAHDLLFEMQGQGVMNQAIRQARSALTTSPAGQRCRTIRVSGRGFRQSLTADSLDLMIRDCGDPHGRNQMQHRRGALPADGTPSLTGQVAWDAVAEISS